MRIILKQNFPLGRYHANPWRAFAFDDPHGEWPPSPWRLLRAILARSFQLSRERENACDDDLRQKLVTTFCESKISFQLPTQSWRGPGLQQYQPSEFKKIPAAAAKPGEKTYNTTKNKDNFWLVSAETDALFWSFVSENWTNELLAHFDECLARMTYFGRAESITAIERLKHEDIIINTNCELKDKRTSTSVPVLCPRVDATFEQVACQTNDDTVANSTTPPGAVWKYAERPSRAKPVARQPTRKALPLTQIVQFAIGGRVFPSLRYWLRITDKFRGIALRQLAQQLTGNRNAKFAELPSETRTKFSLFTGKGAADSVLAGHQHTAFFLIPDSQGKPSRLICWRNAPFTDQEQTALLAAAEAPLAWDFGSDDWKLRLVPLPVETPLPPDKNIFGESSVWETLTPFVPPLHVFGRNGKPKNGFEIETQIKNILSDCKLPSARVTLLSPSDAPTQWVKVHRPQRSRNEQTNADKRGFRIRLQFEKSAKGPIYLGHSCHFGLGLFMPVPDKEE
jgi:CRISPR-associated protein Csb2